MILDLELDVRIPDTFRANRARSMYNVEPELASKVRIHADFPVEDRAWSVGLVVGPSGSGKTSIGSRIGRVYAGEEWPPDRPIIDVIGPDQDMDDAAGALSAVGLGSVPSWLRPYRVLSGGERFRADLARILLDPAAGAGSPLVYDEFTSVVDRTAAKIGSGAFAKAWRRKPGGPRFVALSCHRDIEEWLCPDWVLDTDDWSFSWRSLRRPPSLEVEIVRTGPEAWSYFEPHHYLKVGALPGRNYVGVIGGEPVCHVVASTFATGNLRLGRLVVMPEWQGAGVGIRFLEAVAGMWASGEERPPGRRWRLKSIAIHTSHPGLIAGLSRRSSWKRQATVLGRDGAHQFRGIGKGHTRAVSAFYFVGGGG